MTIRNLAKRLGALSLATHFLVAGGAFSVLAMVVVGVLVTGLIEEGVTQNSAAATALYVDSVIAPLLPDMQRSSQLDESVIQALDETLRQGPLRARLVTFRLWGRGGVILYSSGKTETGKRWRRAAWSSRWQIADRVSIQIPYARIRSAWQGCAREWKVSTDASPSIRRLSEQGSRWN
jgi:hypothetical protein